jgi:hypothetical protein
VATKPRTQKPQARRGGRLGYQVPRRKNPPRLPKLFEILGLSPKSPQEIYALRALEKKLKHPTDVLREPTLALYKFLGPGLFVFQLGTNLLENDK